MLSLWLRGSGCSPHSAAGAGYYGYVVSLVMLIVSLYEVRYDLLYSSFLQIEIRDHPGIICIQIGQFLFAEILPQRFGQPAIFFVHRFQQFFPFRVSSSRMKRLIP